MNLRQNLTTTDIIGTLSALTRNARLNIFEIVFLTLALLFAAFIAFFYLSKLQPLNSRVAYLQERENELRLKLDKINSDEKKRIEQASNSEKILDSLNKFEKYLKPDERGMTQIINEIDLLGKTHRIIVGEARYRVADADATTDENGNTKAASNDKRVNIYPVLGIDTTVVGDYLNLRRFIFDLERSKQFLIINSLKFQGEADKVRSMAISPGGGPGAGPGKGQQVQLSGPQTIPVSLMIELDTYFQKSTGMNQ